MGLYFPNYQMRGNDREWRGKEGGREGGVGGTCARRQRYSEPCLRVRDERRSAAKGVGGESSRVEPAEPRLADGLEAPGRAGPGRAGTGKLPKPASRQYGHAVMVGTGTQRLRLAAASAAGRRSPPRAA